MSDFSDSGASDYQTALKVWATDRQEELADALEGVWFWDRVLIRAAESFGEYQTMRQARLVRVAEWVMVQRISPSS